MTTETFGQPSLTTAQNGADVLSGRWVYDWEAHGNCNNTDPDGLFVEGRAQRLAKEVCKGCPVVIECLADALDRDIEHGVWGDRTARERRALLRKHPNIKSWTKLFMSYKQGDNKA